MERRYDTTEILEQIDKLERVNDQGRVEFQMPKQSALASLILALQTSYLVDLMSEHNDRERAKGNDYVRRLNNFLTREAQHWPDVEASRRDALCEVAKIIGWNNYPD